MLFCDTSDFLDRLDRTNLVVCKHYRNQDCFRCDCFLKFIQFYNTVLVYIYICDLCAAFLQIFTGMENCMMLDLCCNDVVSFCFICLKGSLQSPVIRLGTTCCEINFFFLCSKNFCDLLSSFGDRLFALACKIINTGRVAIIF